MSQFKWDCSNLRDPIGQQHLRSLNGCCQSVKDFVKQDPRVDAIIDECKRLAQMQKSSPSYEVTIAFMDKKARFISTAVAEIVKEELIKAGYFVKVEHTALTAKV